MARSLIALAGVAPVGAFFVEFVIESTARLHMKNPAWPPHAKFHNGHGILMGIAAAIATLITLFVLEPRTANTALAAAGTASIYWVGMLGARAFPGTSWSDAPGSPVSGLPLQARAAMVFLALLAAAVILIVLE